MTTTGKPDPDRGARFLEKLMTEDPEHLDVADDEEIERQMDAAGITVKDVPSAEELMALAAKKAAAAVQGPRAATTTRVKTATTARAAVRRGRPGAIAAAVAVGAVGIAALLNRGAIVAYVKGVEPIGPDPSWSPQKKAEAIRGEAFAACDAKKWTECVGKLDEAAKLDPAGESEPRVVAARRAVSDATPKQEKEKEEETPKEPRLK